MTSTGYVRNFNLRSHEGSDTVALETLNSYLNFNPRSHEGSDYSRLWALLLHQYFNPRSHEGSDECVRKVNAISNLDFNPRSHEGSDDNGRVLEAEYLNFNPRSHEGSDSISFDICTMTAISIHAPTRGATAIVPHVSKRFRFQSTLPRGERRRLDLGRYLVVRFQSTLPRGERRHRFIKGSRSGYYFNPRSHEGSDS